MQQISRPAYTCASFLKKKRKKKGEKNGHFSTRSTQILTEWQLSVLTTPFGLDEQNWPKNEDRSRVRHIAAQIESWKKERTLCQSGDHQLVLSSPAAGGGFGQSRGT